MDGVKKPIVAIIVTIFTLVMCAFVFSACNVTRLVQTKAEYFQHGDTTTTIVTKTTESYDASKRW